MVEREGDTVKVTSCMTEYSYAKCSEHSTTPTSMPASSPCTCPVVFLSDFLCMQAADDMKVRRNRRYGEDNGGST